MNSKLKLKQSTPAHPWVTHNNSSGDQRWESSGASMQLISREELRARLDRGDDFKLVMTWTDQAYQAKHIPGSIHIFEPDKALKLLDPEDEIVVYCTNVACNASITAYWFLVNHGYQHVWRYAGGLLDWERAGCFTQIRVSVRGGMDDWKMLLLSSTLRTTGAQKFPL